MTSSPRVSITRIRWRWGDGGVQHWFLQSLRAVRIQRNSGPVSAGTFPVSPSHEKALRFNKWTAQRLCESFQTFLSWWKKLFGRLVHCCSSHGWETDTVSDFLNSETRWTLWQVWSKTQPVTHHWVSPQNSSAASEHLNRTPEARVHKSDKSTSSNSAAKCFWNQH